MAFTKFWAIDKEIVRGSQVEMKQQNQCPNYSHSLSGAISRKKAQKMGYKNFIEFVFSVS